MNCNVCGQPIAEGGKFCAFCGAPAPIPTPQKAFCGNCGAKVIPGTRFCASCGKPVDAPAAPAAPVVPVAPQVKPVVAAPVVPEAEPVVAAPVVPEAEPIVAAPVVPEAEPVAPVFEPAAPVVPEADPFAAPAVPEADPFAPPAAPVNNPFADFGPTPAPAPYNSTAPFSGEPEPKRKRKRKWPIVLSVIAGILVVAIVAALLTNCFGFYGPATKMMLAAKKTLKAECFTVVISQHIKMPSGDFLYKSEQTYEISIDFEKEDLTVVGIDEEGNITNAIYNGYSISYNDWNSCYTCYDCSEAIEKFFAVYKSAEDMDIEELLEEMFDEDEREEFEEEIDMKELKKAVRSLFQKANSNSWLKENAGYSKSNENGMTVYTFNPDLYKLLSACLEEVEDVFTDHDTYEDLEDELDDSKKSLRKNDLTVSVGVKKGQLAEISIDMETDYRTRSIEYRFERIGTTGIDSDTLDDILEEALSNRDNDDYFYYE